MRFLAIYIVALFSFATLAYASVRGSGIHYSETPESRGFFCDDCGADRWIVGYIKMINHLMLSALFVQRST